MRKHVHAAILANILALPLPSAAETTPSLRDVSTVPLSELVGPAGGPMAVEGGPEQHPPAYLGLKPYDSALGAVRSGGKALPARLRPLGEAQIARLARTLPYGRFELEGWPAPDEYGMLTWAFARWRRSPEAEWRWLDSAQMPEGVQGGPLLPRLLRPWIAADEKEIFDDFLKLPELIDQPVFVDCVWTDEAGSYSRGAWLPEGERAVLRAQIAALTQSGERWGCRLTPQPARWDGAPAALDIGVETDADGRQKVAWPAGLTWLDEPPPIAAGPAAKPPAIAWPPGYAASFRADDQILSGEAEAQFPISGRKAVFNRKNSSDPQSQLERVADYLEERYRKLGIRTERQRFNWRGIPQSNLIAVIEGSLPSKKNRPVLLMDHIDTAYCEDIFEKDGRRVSAPGADDNASGTAALLRAAERLSKSRPKHDIWLVHLTGEEYPAAGIGSWRLIQELLGRRRAISGIVLLDMIGHRNPGDGVFQINPGDSPRSAALAKLALDLSPGLVEPWMKPILRPWGDAKSYLYNTDGIFFADAGYPIILLNEHINRLENYGRPGHHRPGYHRSDDVSAGVDFDYAASISKVAIATVSALANAQP